MWCQVFIIKIKSCGSGVSHIDAGGNIAVSAIDSEDQAHVDKRKKELRMSGGDKPRMKSLMIQLNNYFDIAQMGMPTKPSWEGSNQGWHKHQAIPEELHC
jgi:hypothetical protein